MSDATPGTTMQRPYLLRAMHEWMTDNALTPHIVIDVAAANTVLPLEYAKDGKLIINISYSATENLFIDNEHASFAARFAGVSRHLDVPISAIVGIYARETGQGMIFSSEQQPSHENASPARPSRASIEVVAEPPDADESTPSAAKDDGPGPTGDDEPRAGKRARPKLKIIK